MNALDLVKIMVERKDEMPDCLAYYMPQALDIIAAAQEKAGRREYEFMTYDGTKKKARGYIRGYFAIDDYKSGSWRRWAVTHTVSGRLASPESGFDKLSRAQAYCDALMALQATHGVDWSLETPDLTDDAIIQTVRALQREYRQK